MKRFFFLIFTATIIFQSCTNQSDKMRELISQGIKEIYNSNYDLAKKYLNEASEINPNNAEPYYYLGLIEFNQLNYSKAMEYIDMALEKNSEYGEAYRTKAQIFFLQGNQIEACKNYKLAAKYGIENLANHLKNCP